MRSLPQKTESTPAYRWEIELVRRKAGYWLLPGKIQDFILHKEVTCSTKSFFPQYFNSVVLQQISQIIGKIHLGCSFVKSQLLSLRVGSAASFRKKWMIYPNLRSAFIESSDWGRWGIRREVGWSSLGLSLINVDLGRVFEFSTELTWKWEDCHSSLIILAL